ncbi:flagellar biosynthetic protein FliO [Rhizobacter sp. Root1221]|uniref:flagellar biosynthetic protein FliO n=1 Tax=Rhizobacter sp. Root1221 TaxID=1736433 RepID=UPI000701DCDE|nr:flagellar biosynthetic protein FliO [Rhizobacter sp. Root1221]KQV92864.1 hypothetical protein ASC87_27300 [Rhizobacter sp. Root1221]
MSGLRSCCRAVLRGGWVLAPALAGAAEGVVPVVPQASSPLPFRTEATDPGFPVAGAVLLLVLVAVAAGAWWFRHRRSGPWLQRLVTPAPAEVRVVSSVRLDVNTRLHVVEWKRRQLLVAVQGAGAPVVLDRDDAPAAPVEPTT